MTTFPEAGSYTPDWSGTVQMRVSRLLLGLALAAAGGLVVFGLMVWQSVTVERASADGALTRFMAVRSKFVEAEPLLRVDSDGRVVLVRSKESPPAGPAPKYLRVLAYRAATNRLAQANVAFWFLRLKGPAVKYSLRETGLDFDRLNISPAELASYGPCLVFDETGTDGGRLLVWTE